MQKKTAPVLFFFVFLVQACASPTLEPKTSIPSPTLTSVPTSTETPKPALTATVTVEPTSTIEVLSALEGIDTIQFDIDGDGVVDYIGIVKAENSIDPNSIKDLQVNYLSYIRVVKPGEGNTLDYYSVLLPGSYYTGYQEIEMEKNGEKSTMVFYTMSFLRPDKTWVHVKMSALKPVFVRWAFDLDANLGGLFIDVMNLPNGAEFSDASIKKASDFHNYSEFDQELVYKSKKNWLDPNAVRGLIENAPAGTTLDWTFKAKGSPPQK